METSFPAILEILSFELQSKSHSELNCSISMMKGLQNFGEIKFKMGTEQNKYTFKPGTILNFSYTIRLTTRKDFFFHIVLTNLQSNEQIGDDIGISCHMLAQAFQNDKNAVIQKQGMFFEGIILRYKVYQPVLDTTHLDLAIGFKNIHKNDFISNLFSRPQIQEDVNMMKTSKIKKSKNNMKKSMNSGKNSKVGNEQPTQKQIQTETLKVSATLKKSDLIKQPHQKEQFFSKIFKYVKQSGFVDKNKKYSFSSNQGHHGSHGLSKKLKFVIFLLIMGAVLLFVDSITDSTNKKSSKKSSKKKSEKKGRVAHF